MSRHGPSKHGQLGIGVVQLCVEKKTFHLAMEVLGQAFSGAPSLSDRRECDLRWFSILHWVHATHWWSDSSSFQHESQWICFEDLHKLGILQELLRTVDILLAWWSKGKQLWEQRSLRIILSVSYAKLLVPP